MSPKRATPPLYPKPGKLRKQLKKLLGFTPGRLRHYEYAFIHRSASITDPEGNPINNERLEFLGDAILDAVISDTLYLNYPDRDEGYLSKLRSGIVRRETLNQLAAEMKLDELLISHTDANRKVKHLGGNSLEALIGAIYLDRGYKKTKKFISRSILGPYLTMTDLQENNRDYKSRLIEWGQKRQAEMHFKHESHPSGKNIMIFTTRILMNDQLIGTGTGDSKKESEQQASRDALNKIGS